MRHTQSVLPMPRRYARTLAAALLPYIQHHRTVSTDALPSTPIQQARCPVSSCIQLIDRPRRTTPSPLARYGARVFGDRCRGCRCRPRQHPVRDRRRPSNKPKVIVDGGSRTGAQSAERPARARGGRGGAGPVSPPSMLPSPSTHTHKLRLSPNRPHAPACIHTGGRASSRPASRLAPHRRPTTASFGG